MSSISISKLTSSVFLHPKVKGSEAWRTFNFLKMSSQQIIQSSVANSELHKVTTLGNERTDAFSTHEGKYMEDEDFFESDETDVDDEGAETEESDHKEEDFEDIEAEGINQEELRRERAKAKRRRRKGVRPHLEDIEGAVPTETLRKCSNNLLRQLIKQSKDEIKRLRTENFLFEKAIEKLEAPEKVLEEMYSAKAEDAEDGEESTAAHSSTVECPSDDSSEEDDEEEEREDYIPLVPIEEIHVSTDSFFDNMSVNSKEAALTYFKNIGGIAPPNYDVFRDKYKEWVKGGKNDPDYKTKSGAAHKNPTRLRPEVYDRGVALIKEKNKKITVESRNKAAILLSSNWIPEDEFTRGEFWEEIDPEYPDFDLSNVKLLGLQSKLNIALQAEESFRKIFYQYETKILKEESAIQVNIDAHKHSAKILLGLRKDIKYIMTDMHHPLPLKAISDFILRVKRKSRTQITGEETKARMAIRKVKSMRERAIHQIKCSQNAEYAVGEIDFEHLNVENEIFQNEMEDMNISLKYLKQLSSNFFHTLLEEQEEMKEIKEEEGKLAAIVNHKRKAHKTFENTFSRYKNLIQQTMRRIEGLKKKIKEYHAPKPLEYTQLKAGQHEMTLEIAGLKKKLQELNYHLITARSNYARICKSMPKGDQTEADTESWLQEIKDEVAAKDLMALLNEPDPEEDKILPESLRRTQHHVNISHKGSHHRTIGKSRFAGSSKSSKSRAKLQGLIQAVGKIKASKNTSTQPSDYDADYDFKTML